MSRGVVGRDEPLPTGAYTNPARGPSARGERSRFHSCKILALTSVMEIQFGKRHGHKGNPRKPNSQGEKDTFCSMLMELDRTRS